MTALEEIKKALEGVTPVAWRYRMKNWSEQYWHHFNTEPKFKEPDEIWEPLYSPDSLASTIESLQAEENRLRAIALDMQAGYREAVARAETTDKSLDSLCAWLLHRFGPNTPEGREASCRMSPRTALASTGGEHHADK